MSLEEHLGAMLGQVGPLEPLDITLREAIGCQLVGDVAAPNPVPHYARAAISGYAVRSVDLTGPATLKVVDDVQPGFAPTQPVYAGVAVRLSAGSPIRAGRTASSPAPRPRPVPWSNCPTWRRPERGSLPWVRSRPKGKRSCATER